MTMTIRTAQYIGSFVHTDGCPKDGKPLMAFIGRSNVGKSSLINALCHQKKLAKVSQTPGKTQTLNYFLINEEFYFVDMPGYGYAKNSKKNIQQWALMNTSYLVQQRLLKMLLVLIDASIPPQQKDLEFLNLLGERNIPFAIVFTKTDKATQKITQQHIRLFSAKMLQTWEDLPPFFAVSSVKKTGLTALQEFIQENITA